MARFRNLAVKAALLLFALTELAQAQQEVPRFDTDGPQFCPPLNEFLSPTLLDVLIYPGFSFR